jgi:hypothetical protein
MSASPVPPASLKLTARGMVAAFEIWKGFVRSTLVKQQFEGGGQQADAAFAALAALNSYNRTNKLATLHELVRRLIDGDEKVHVLSPDVNLGHYPPEPLCDAGAKALSCVPCDTGTLVTIAAELTFWVSQFLILRSSQPPNRCAGDARGGDAAGWPGLQRRCGRCPGPGAGAAAVHNVIRL